MKKILLGKSFLFLFIFLLAIGQNTAPLFAARASIVIRYNNFVIPAEDINKSVFGVVKAINIDSCQEKKTIDELKIALAKINVDASTAISDLPVATTEFYIPHTQRENDQTTVLSPNILAVANALAKVNTTLAEKINAAKVALEKEKAALLGAQATATTAQQLQAFSVKAQQQEADCDLLKLETDKLAKLLSVEFLKTYNPNPENAEFKAISAVAAVLVQTNALTDLSAIGALEQCKKSAAEIKIAVEEEIKKIKQQQQQQEIQRQQLQQQQQQQVVDKQENNSIKKTKSNKAKSQPHVGGNNNNNKKLINNNEASAISDVNSSNNNQVINQNQEEQSNLFKDFEEENKLIQLNELGKEHIDYIAQPLKELKNLKNEDIPQTYGKIAKNLMVVYYSNAFTYEQRTDADIMGNFITHVSDQLQDELLNILNSNSISDDTSVLLFKQHATLITKVEDNLKNLGHCIACDFLDQANALKIIKNQAAENALKKWKRLKNNLINGSIITAGIAYLWLPNIFPSLQPAFNGLPAH